MLVSAKEMLEKAKAGHYAVGQFNINNLEWTKSILLTAQELNSPVILGVSEGAGKYMTGFKTVAAMVKAMDEELGITVPVALHLDHGTYEGCYKCIKAGFTSIMFDGSHIQSKRTSKRQRSWLLLLLQWECPSRLRLVPSVERKMVLLVPASVRIQMSVRWLQTLEWTCLQQVSVTSMESILQTGQA